MVHKPNYPKNESELRSTLDEMYNLSKKAFENDTRPSFKGLLEVISSETNILSAIHKIKSNKGSQTPGSDGMTIRDDILKKDYEKVIQSVQHKLKWYKAKPVRRVHIPKVGTNETRPLGIPAIEDRIIQECVRMVIEPIFEAQFFNHSYGFRPMRDAHMAFERAADLIHKTGYHWIVEGDISKFFDNVNHTILIKRLWHMGIKDQRVLMIIKQMLQAGIFKETMVNELGTPQGGIISPLLANVYLDALDQWIIREWENKKTKISYTQDSHKFDALRKRSNLKPAFFIRYADDWILITNSKTNAEKWKYRIDRFITDKLNLTLSDKKTLITNVAKKPINFVGFHLKASKGKARRGYVLKSRINPEKLKSKMSELRKDIKTLRHLPAFKNEGGRNVLIDNINIVNSKIRGIIQYYEAASYVSSDLSKYADSIKYTSYKSLKRLGGKWVPANRTKNLPSVHQNYTTQIPAYEYKGFFIGITSLSFCSWKKVKLKNQKETPYTKEGRELYQKRTNKTPLLVRADELFSLHTSKIIALGKSKKLYNFEYLMNRAYVFNRDRGKCKICDDEVDNYNIHIHHHHPKFPLDLINRVQYLSTVHEKCHRMIHDMKDYSYLNKKTWNSILKFRDKLEKTAISEKVKVR